MSGARTNTQAGGWPRRCDTAAIWREIAPHFTDAQCERMAAKERERIKAEAGKFATLAAKLREIDLNEQADNALMAAEHGVSFPYYVGVAVQAVQSSLGGKGGAA